MIFELGCLVIAALAYFLAWESRSLYHTMVDRGYGEDLSYTVGFAAFATGLFIGSMGLIGAGF